MLSFLRSLWRRLFGSKGASDELWCSFCGKPLKDVVRLVAGPKAYICNECVAYSNEIVAAAVADPPETVEPGEPNYGLDGELIDDSGWSCSFCGKQKEEVDSLIAGPCVFICDECLILCTKINAKALAEQD